jgi:hypothetical protein
MTDPSGADRVEIIHREGARDPGPGRMYGDCLGCGLPWPCPGASVPGETGRIGDPGSVEDHVPERSLAIELESALRRTRWLYYQPEDRTPPPLRWRLAPDVVARLAPTPWLATPAAERNLVLFGVAVIEDDRLAPGRWELERLEAWSDA